MISPPHSRSAALSPVRSSFAHISFLLFNLAMMTLLSACDIGRFDAKSSKSSGSGGTTAPGAAPAGVAVNDPGNTLSGDVTGPASNNTVAKVGGRTAAEVAVSVADTQAASSANAGTLVKRDANGNF